MPKKQIFMLGACALGLFLLFPLFVCSGFATACAGWAQISFTISGLALLGDILLFAALLHRWILRPYRSFCHGLNLALSLENRVRLTEENGPFSAPARSINKFMDAYEIKEKKYDNADQRYRLMAKLSDDVTFEYNLQNNTVCDSTNWDILADGNQFIKGTIARQIVHPEDAALFENFFRGAMHAGEYREVELRLRVHPTEPYKWMQIRGVVLADAQKVPEKILGRRYNIDKAKREWESLREQAQHDMLTGLYNKSTAERIMSQILNSGDCRNCALLLIDIDYFKEVNDTLGHQAGDEVLKEAAKGITMLFRQQDMIGRIGGDEFLVLFQSSIEVSLETLQKRCEQILKVFSALPASERFQRAFSCSIGAARYPQDGANFDDLFRYADIALYDAKKCGRGCWRLYSHASQAACN